MCLSPAPRSLLHFLHFLHLRPRALSPLISGLPVAAVIVHVAATVTVAVIIVHVVDAAVAVVVVSCETSRVADVRFTSQTFFSVQTLDLLCRCQKLAFQLLTTVSKRLFFFSKVLMGVWVGQGTAHTCTCY